MRRDQKTELVKELNTLFNDDENVSLVLVAQYKGLDVASISSLRKQMKQEGAYVKVAKNSLTKIALKDTRFEPVADIIDGQSLIAYSADPIVAAKVAVNFAKDNENLVVLGGQMHETVLDENGIKHLASMPSLDELRAKIISIISTPATRIAGVTQAPAGQLARVLNAYATKDEAA